MSKPRTTRERKTEKADEPTATAKVEVARDPRVDDVRMGRRAPAAPEQPPAPSASRFTTDDLQAIASMDPAELALLMGATSQRRIEEGDQVTGRITAIGRDFAFVDVGGKAEAVIDSAEVAGNKPGDEITAWVTSSSELGVQISRRLSGEVAESFLEEAMQSGAPVEGKVEARNSGGFTVRLGTVRGFCPVSMIDRHPGDLDAYVGQTFEFRVVEAGKEPVVSRRAIQEAALAEDRQRFWNRVEPGDRYEGVVTSVKDYGAFVDVGGVEGLVHKSELGTGNVADATQVVQKGQTLSVHVVKVDRIALKLTLSARDTRTAEALPEASSGTNSFGTMAGLLGGLNLKK